MIPALRARSIDYSRALNEFNDRVANTGVSPRREIYRRLTQIASTVFAFHGDAQRYNRELERMMRRVRPDDRGAHIHARRVASGRYRVWGQGRDYTDPDFTLRVPIPEEGDRFKANNHLLWRLMGNIPVTHRTRRWDVELTVGASPHKQTLTILNPFFGDRRVPLKQVQKLVGVLIYQALTARNIDHTDATPDGVSGAGIPPDGVNPQERSYNWFRSVEVIKRDGVHALDRYVGARPLFTNPVNLLMEEDSYSLIGGTQRIEFINMMIQTGATLTDNPRARGHCFTWAVELALKEKTYEMLTKRERNTISRAVQRTNEHAKSTLKPDGNIRFEGEIPVSIQTLQGEIPLSNCIHMPEYASGESRLRPIYNGEGRLHVVAELYLLQKFSRRLDKTELAFVDVFTGQEAFYLRTCSKEEVETTLMLGVFLNHVYAVVPGVTSNKIINKPYEINPKKKNEASEDLVFEADLQEEMLLTYDLETTADTDEPYLAGLYAREIFHCFSLTHGDPCIQLLEFLCDELKRPEYKHKTTLIYAHNAGAFDNMFLVQAILKHKPNFVEIDDIQSIRNGLTDLVLKFKHGSFDRKGQYKKAHFRDSLTILPFNLMGLCSSFKTEIKKGDVPHHLITLETWGEEPRLRDIVDYLKDDCRSLHEVLTKYRAIVMDISEGKVNPLKYPTIAAIGRNLFFKCFHDREAHPLYSLGWDDENKFREGYTGGRTECFALGQHSDEWYYYDFTSLYPTCQATPMPYDHRVREFLNLPEEDEATVELAMFYLSPAARREFSSWALCEVTGDIDSKYQFFACKEDNRLVFPRFSTPRRLWIHSEEILALNARGLISFTTPEEGKYFIKPIELHVWKAGNVFTACINKLFELKQQNNDNPALRFVAKILVNSLYGSFGFNGNERKGIAFVRNVHEEDLSDILSIRKFKSIGKNQAIVKTKKNVQVSYASVITAMTVTSKARLMLWELMYDAEKMVGAFTIYGDTDSVFVNKPLEEIPYFRDKYFADNWLGSLKNEEGPGKSISQVCINGPKFYSYLDEEGNTACSKIKGFYKRITYRKSYDLDLKIIRMTQDHSADDKLTFGDHCLVTEGWMIEHDPFSFISRANVIFNDEDPFHVKKEKKKILLSRYEREFTETGVNILEDKYSKGVVLGDRKTIIPLIL